MLEVEWLGGKTGWVAREVKIIHKRRPVGDVGGEVGGEEKREETGCRALSGGVPRAQAEAEIYRILR